MSEIGIKQWLSFSQIKAFSNSPPGNYTKSGLNIPVKKEAIEIASTQTKPACAGFRNKGGKIPGFGINSLANS
jgi:hypothetical protein